MLLHRISRIIVAVLGLLLAVPIVFGPIALVAILGRGAAVLPGDPGDWSVREVGEWAAALPGVAASDALVRALRREQVSGAVLLYLDEEALRDDLGIASSLQRKIVLAAIDALVASSLAGDASTSAAAAAAAAAAASGATSGTTSKTCTLTFYEYRQQHRQIFDQLTGLLSTAPRWAISLLPGLPSAAQPAAPFRDDFPMNWVVWFFVPEYYLYENASTIACGLPGLLPYVILLNMVLRLVELVRALATRRNATVANTLLGLAFGPLVVELKWGMGMWFYITFVWPFLPWFICDLIFQLNIWIFSGLHIWEIVRLWWAGEAGKPTTSGVSTSTSTGPGGFSVYTTGFSM
jgi:hypothetical protein